MKNSYGQNELQLQNTGGQTGSQHKEVWSTGMGKINFSVIMQEGKLALNTRKKYEVQVGAKLTSAS